MKKRRWVVLTCFVLSASFMACSPIEEEPLPQISETDQIDGTSDEENITTDDFSITAASPIPTTTPPMPPTAEPTSNPVDIWQLIGSSSGLQVAIPPTWTNLTGQLLTTAVSNELGLIAFLGTDTERTGQGLLAGKGIDRGAYVGGFISTTSSQTTDPVTVLNQLLTTLNADVTPVTAAQPFTLAQSSSAGAVIELVGTPIGFQTSNPTAVQTRLLLFLTPDPFDPANQIQATFLFSAAAAQWDSYADLFAEMSRTILLQNLQSTFSIGDGQANVVGEITNQSQESGTLMVESNDLWTFTVSGSEYAAITLNPVDADLDLSFTVFSPSGQVVARIDNGFAGDSEVVTDLILVENGRYVIEVSEFFRMGGRYNLNLVLTEQPLFGSGGRIQLGQGIQGELPADRQHVWTFAGTAGQIVSIVLTPVDPFDIILDLYAPDGRLIVSLDEGFNGDSEVIAGLELSLTGEYEILIRSFSNEGGSYTLTLDAGGESLLNFFEVGDLVYGDSARNSLNPREAHAWYFNGKAGDEIILEVVPVDQTLDLDIWLFDPQVERLAEKDEFLAGIAETIHYTLPGDGQYLILVRDFSGNPGQYEINLMASPVATPRVGGQLAFGESVNGMLAAGETAVYYFNATEGDRIDLLLTANDSDKDLLFTVQNPEGIAVLQVDEQLTGSNESITNFRIDSSGQWGIVVREFFGESTTYTVTLQRTQ